MKDGVCFFDFVCMICLVIDWFVDGIGFFLMQKYCQCLSKIFICCNDGWKLCLVGSRFIYLVESRYVFIEGEVLVVVYVFY